MKQKYRPKPNFLIIGAAKAGTSSLASLLAAHPEAGIALGEQPNFFSWDDKYKFGWKRYLRLFEHCEGKKAIGDASTSYSRLRYHPQTIERIREHIRQPKIIYMVRHPLDRMISAYVDHMNSPKPPDYTSINDAVKKQPMIVDSSRYWEVFDAYRQAFGDAQVKVLWYEEYVSDTAKVFRDVCQFLQINDAAPPKSGAGIVDPKADAEQAQSTVTSKGIQLTPTWEADTRKWVIDQIKADNCRLLQHFGKPLDHWGDLFQNV